MKKTNAGLAAKKGLKIDMFDINQTVVTLFVKEVSKSLI